MNVLILNTQYQPVDIWSWQKAMKKLLCSSSVYVVEYSDNTIRDSKQRVYRVPSILALKRYHNNPNQLAKYSKTNIYSRDLLVCQYCGCNTTHDNRTVDHVIPKSVYNPKKHKFPLNSFENVVTCCYPCNRHKGDKTPEQRGMKLIKQPRRVTRAEVYRNKLKLVKVPLEWLKYVKEEATR
jgi:5-methylcytosine-specific restriction endonuclease McrA